MTETDARVRRHRLIIIIYNTVCMPCRVSTLGCPMSIVHAFSSSSLHHVYNVQSDQICKLLRSLGIDSKESIPPAYVAWRAGTTTLFLLGIDPASLCSMAGRYDNPIPTRFLAPIDCSKIPALSSNSV
jgi:hypothetical protein